MPSPSDPISAMLPSLLSSLLTEIALDVALEAHSEIKRGRLLCTVCGTFCKASGSHCPPPSNLSISAANSQTLQANASPSSSRSTTPMPSSLVGSKKPLSALEKDFNQPTVDSSSGNIYFDCLNCSKPIASVRYAPHLSKCLGLAGRRTTGRATTRLKLGSEAGNSSDVESVTSKSKMKGVNGNAKRNGTPTKASALSKRQKTSSASLVDSTPILTPSIAPPPPPLPPSPIVPPPPPPPPQHSYGGATPPRLQSKLSNGYDDDENGGYDYLAVDGDLVDTDSSGDES
ncbi:hypothetical protein BDY24DRAFT_396794 [Mrakia frigida]|uniref:SGF11 family protein n=1 Tax=Mrakia frigida TaxID=29902 RepID=UPI003FCC0E61